MEDAVLIHAAGPGVSPKTVSERDTSVVTFQIGYQQYGLPLAVVIEIVRLPALVALAGSPPTLCGLLNLRGQYLPVLDGRALVGEPSQYDLNSQIVIAGRGQPELGLLVDQVCDVSTIAVTRITPISRPDVAAFLSSVFDLADGSVLLFDLAALMALAPAKANLRARNGTKMRESRNETGNRKLTIDDRR